MRRKRYMSRIRIPKEAVDVFKREVPEKLEDTAKEVREKTGLKGIKIEYEFVNGDEVKIFLKCYGHAADKPEVLLLLYDKVNRVLKEYGMSLKIHK